MDTQGGSPIDIGEGRYAIERREWLAAPADKYFVNASVTPENFAGQNARCELGRSDDVHERDVALGNGTIRMTFVKKCLMVARSEAVSLGGGNSRIEPLTCVFNAQLSPLPN